MNRFETPFGRKLLWASLIPLLLLSCILLIADFISLRNSQNTIHRNAFDLASRLLSQIEPLTELPIDQKKFSLIADILLSDTQIVGLSLSNDNDTIIFQAGIPAHPAITNTEQHNSPAPMQKDGNWIATIANAHQTWTIVLDDESIQLALYQNVLIHLIIFGTFLIVLILVYTRFKVKFFSPIHALAHYLLSLKLTPHYAIPSPAELTYLHDCALLINDVINGLNHNQEEMRNSYEAALSDFKESLESVEIQNIEMDLARKSAVQAERVKSEFLIHASSDLLEPLRQCLRAIQQLSRLSSDAEQADYTHNLETTIKGIIGLAQDIVDFSRLENGKFQLEVKSVQIRQIAQDALTFYAPMAAAINSRILSIIQPDVFDVLLGDPRRLQQILGNLINKVLNHGRHGNIAIKASVLRSEPTAQLIKFSVIDCNGGFDDDFIVQFKMLIDGKNIEVLTTKGASLGLSIARNLVEKMGGELGLELEPSDQPCIWFTARMQIPENCIQTTVPPIAPLKGCNVLVIDEQPASRLELTTLLHSLGASYLEINRMDDLAIHMSRWAEFKPQIAIIDILNFANEFDKQTTLNTITSCNERLGISCVVVASSAAAGNLQRDLDPINARVINRPLLPGKLHQALTHQIAITPILNAVNSTPKIIPKITAHYSHRILVVDDNPSNTKLIAEFLKQLPLDIITCESGATALSHCRDKRFDLIFMDIQMPDADGFAVTAKIRELELGETRTPIIALTAQSAAENKTKYIVGGMDDHLSKPVSYEDLIQLIGKWLGKAFLPAEINPTKTPQPIITPPSEPIDAIHQPVVIVQECLRLAKDNALLARDMLQMLIEGLVQDPVDLSQLLATHNWPELQHYAHKLYGGACYCGVPALKDAAQTLDRSVQKGELDNLEMQINTLQLEIQRLIAWSKDYDLDALFELA